MSPKFLTDFVACIGLRGGPHSMRPSRSPSPEHDAPDRAALATGGARPALARRTRANSRAETGFGYFERLLVGSGAITFWESNVRRSSLRQLVAVGRLKRTLPTPREISLRFFLRARPAAPRPSLICVTFVRFRLSLVATGGWHYAGWLLLLALHARAVRAARRARGPVRLCHDRHRRHAGQRHGPLGVGGDRRTRLPPRAGCHLRHQSHQPPSRRQRGRDRLPRPPRERTRRARHRRRT